MDTRRPFAMLPPSLRPARSACIGGFTLIEVLVSILVLSLGVLGAVGMLTAGIQSNREARLQSVAVNLGRELGEMMRANKATAILQANNPYLFDHTATRATSFDARGCMSTTCNAGADIASADVAEWQRKLGDQLPGARAVVCFDNAPYDASGRPQWACNVAGGSGGTVVVKIGWTRMATDRGTQTANGIELANRPTVVLPLIAGL
jgi:type IV pilus assembly protein PilV